MAADAEIEKLRDRLTEAMEEMCNVRNELARLGVGTDTKFYVAPDGAAAFTPPVLFRVIAPNVG